MGKWGRRGGGKSREEGTGRDGFHSSSRAYLCGVHATVETQQQICSNSLVVRCFIDLYSRCIGRCIDTKNG